MIITLKILEHIINRMLKHQNKWTDLFFRDINKDYKNAIMDYKNATNEDTKDQAGVYFCDWYLFVVKNNKATFYIVDC